MHALYPQTTCFYRAKVNKQPRTAAEGYELLFDDDAYDTGVSPPLSVPQRYVIVYKNPKKSSSSSS